MMSGITGTIILERGRNGVNLTVCPRGLGEPSWNCCLTSRPANWLSSLYKMLAIPESKSEVREVSFSQASYNGGIVLSQPGSNYSLQMETPGWRRTTVNPTRSDLVELAYLFEKLPPNNDLHQSLRA